MKRQSIGAGRGEWQGGRVGALLLSLPLLVGKMATAAETVIDGPWLPSASRAVTTAGASNASVADAPLPWSRLSVTEVPAIPVPGAPPQRAHHALRYNTDVLQPWMRGVGLDASECFTLFRMPSKFHQRSANADAGFEARAEVRLACKF